MTYYYTLAGHLFDVNQTNETNSSWNYKTKITQQN